MNEHGTCQLHGIPKMSEGAVPLQSRSIRWRLKLFLKRHLSHERKRVLKKWMNGSLSLSGRGRSIPAGNSHPLPPTASTRLQAADRVRVRSLDEIKATLDRWGALRGCIFMNEMQPYCGTVQRVFKPVTQFLDEREYRLIRCRNVVLLEGVLCQGIEEYGPCDRSCYFFWREEWLEKLLD